MWLASSFLKDSNLMIWKVYSQSYYFYVNKLLPEDWSVYILSNSKDYIV